MMVDKLTAPSRYFSRWTAKIAFAGLVSLVIAMIWIAALNHYVAAAAIASVIVLVITVLVFRALDERESFDFKVAERERRLATAQMFGDIGNWSYDAASDILRSSSLLSRAYGNETREMSLDEAWKAISPEEREIASDAFVKVIETGGPHEYQRVAQFPDGTRRLHRVIVYPTKNAEGAIVGFHGLDQDITAVKRLEALESRIVDLSRLDEMHIMAATLAHEISQPLTAASNYLAASRRMLGRAAVRPDPAIVEMIRCGEEQIFNAGEIVQRARKKVSADDRAPVTVADAWNKAVQLVENTAPAKRILFTTDIGPGADVVVADSVQLGQVLGNLMRNSVEAAREDAAYISLTTCRDDEGFVRFSLCDNGSGIVAHDRDFFALLATTKEVGLGLGLVISRTIVESHGGKIWIETTGPEGTVIAFTLPAPAA